jgi:DNA-directed RNA polymerase specialized sigma24 family protein
MTGGPNPDLSHWIARLMDGDPAAVRPLWDAYFDRLVGYVRARVRDANDVDPNGIAASAFRSFWAAVVHGRVDALASRDDLWGLLTLITRRKIARLVERRAAAKRGGHWRRVEVAEIDQFADADDCPDLQAAWADELRGLVTSLGDKSLQVVLLRKLDEQTNEAIGRELGCTVRTVTNKLKLIQLKLSDYLSRAEE